MPMDLKKIAFFNDSSCLGSPLAWFGFSWRSLSAVDLCAHAAHVVAPNKIICFRSCLQPWSTRRRACSTCVCCQPRLLWFARAFLGDGHKPYGYRRRNVQRTGLTGGLPAGESPHPAVHLPFLGEALLHPGCGAAPGASPCRAPPLLVPGAHSSPVRLPCKPAVCCAAPAEGSPRMRLSLETWLCVCVRVRASITESSVSRSSAPVRAGRRGIVLGEPWYLCQKLAYRCQTIPRCFCWLLPGTARGCAARWAFSCGGSSSTNTKPGLGAVCPVPAPPAPAAP